MRFSTMSDSEIISELCRRIKETRMQLGLSQIACAGRRSNHQTRRIR